MNEHMECKEILVKFVNLVGLSGYIPINKEKLGKVLGSLKNEGNAMA